MIISLTKGYIHKLESKLNTKAWCKRRGAQGFSPSVTFNHLPSDLVALKISLE